MYRLAVGLLLAILILAGCNGGATQEAVVSPADLVKQAAANARTVTSLKMSIERSGAEYIFQTDLGSVIFNHLDAQYVAPETIQAKARVMLGKLPIDIEVFARGENQWVRGQFNNMKWQSNTFAADFNPQALISQENSGLQVAMAALKDLKTVGDEQLEDGTAVVHLSATAAGGDVAALIASLIQMTGQVQVDLYVDKEKHLPLKFIVVEPDTATDGLPATTWTIEIYDFNVAAQLDEPDTPAE